MKNYLVFFSCTVFCYFTLSTAERKLRITSNEHASLGEFPYQVSLQQNHQHFCGGSLIKRTHVLTAAHCVHDLVMRNQIGLIKVAVGTITVPGGTYHDVARVAVHPQYNKQTLMGDVAVIRLRTPVKLSRNVKIIKLPKANLQLMSNHRLIASGWGTHVMNGPTSPVLKKLTMSGVPRQQCEQSWGSYISQNPGLLCVSTPTRAGVCQGDSGGPLTINKRVVVGIASAVYGSGCGTGVPDLFTRVIHYLSFIKSQMAR